MKHRHDCVYRSRSQSFVIILAIFSYDVLMLTWLISKPNKPAFTAYAVITMFIITLLGVRASLSAVVTLQAGIRVVNVFKTSQISWNNIEMFDIGQSGLFPQVCRIHTRDGKMLRAFGIQEANVSLLQSQGKRPARKIVAQLNQELAAHTS